MNVTVDGGQIVIDGQRFSPKEVLRSMVQLNKEQERELKSLIKEDKARIVEEFGGLFNVFNFVKKNTKVLETFKAKGCKVQPVDVLGALTFNEFIRLAKNSARYNVQLMYELCARYDAMNEGERVQSSERGQFLNGLILQGRKPEEGAKAEIYGAILSAYAENSPLPVKTAKNGKKTLLISKGAGFFALAYGADIYGALIEELKPEIKAQFEAEKIVIVETSTK